jgi:hypothetical protein
MLGAADFVPNSLAPYSSHNRVRQCLKALTIVKSGRCIYALGLQLVPSLAIGVGIQAVIQIWRALERARSEVSNERNPPTLLKTLLTCQQKSSKEEVRRSHSSNATRVFTIDYGRVDKSESRVVIQRIMANVIDICWGGRRGRH